MKSGKTTIASHFPQALLIAFEMGFNALSGVMAQPVTTWGEFRKVLRELDDPEVKKTFSTIVLDTIDIAYPLCEKYICQRESDMQNDYQNISDIPYGKGYDLAMKEFDSAIRTILQKGYGLVLISHATDKTFKDEKGAEYNQIVPTVDKRARLVCERTCDIIGYSRVVETDDGEYKTKLFLRGTPRFVAGSRFKYIVPVIDFNYESLTKALADAVDAEAEHNGANAVTEERENNHAVKELDFNSLMEEFQHIVGSLMQKGDPDMAGKITATVEKYLGKGRKVGECTPSQAQQIDLILYELRKL